MHTNTSLHPSFFIISIIVLAKHFLVTLPTIKRLYALLGMNPFEGISVTAYHHVLRVHMPSKDFTGEDNPWPKKKDRLSEIQQE